MEADAEWQGDAKAMLRAIALDAAAVVEEVLQAGLQIDAKMRREVVLQAESKGGRPLDGHIKSSFFLESIDAVGLMKGVDTTMDRPFQHDTR